MLNYITEMKAYTVHRTTRNPFFAFTSGEFEYFEEDLCDQDTIRMSERAGCCETMILYGNL